jgi:hypothetical protein
VVKRRAKSIKTNVVKRRAKSIKLPACTHSAAHPDQGQQH